MNDITESYCRTADLQHRRRHAQFFTPDLVARWMAEQIRGAQTLLDPALGLGIFPNQADAVSVVGYEIDPVVLRAAALDGVTVRQECFIQADCWGERYDAVLANPPYKNYHDYDITLVDTINSRLGVKLSRQANLSVLFLLKAVSMLKDGGTAAFIVPTEFMDCAYGTEVKRYLQPHLERVVVCQWDVFADALTTACLLVLKKNTSAATVQFQTAPDISHMSAPNVVARSDLNPAEKWRQYWEKCPFKNTATLDTYASVQRGIATGDNKYFCISRRRKEDLGLRHVLPCVSKSAHIKSAHFGESDFALLAERGEPVYLVDMQGYEHEEEVQRYLAHGQELGVHRRYLTRHRQPWYALEQRPVPDYFVGVFSRHGLKVIRNQAKALSLTCFHHVRLADVERRGLLEAWLSTDICKEVLWANRREYGGGLAKFEPSDLARGHVLDLESVTSADCELACRLHRAGNASLLEHLCRRLVDDG